MSCRILSLALLVLTACPPPLPPPSNPKSVQPSGDLPAKLSLKEIQMTMSTLNPQVTKCLAENQTPGKVEMELTLAGNGRFKTVTPIRTFQDTPLAGCIKELLLETEFPHFTDDEMTFIYPFLLLPEQMSTSQFSEALGNLRHKARQCAKGSTEKGEISIQFVISSGGAVEIVKATGSLLTSPIAACVRQVISSTEFPSSSDEMKMHEQFTF